MRDVKLDPINVYPLPNGYTPGRLLPIAVEMTWGSPIYYFFDREDPADIWRFSVRQRFEQPWERFRFGGEQTNPYAPKPPCSGPDCGCVELDKNTE